MSNVPADILRLVGQFEEHAGAYRHGDYNETQVRRDYIDPFFAALGWDVHNVQGYAEAYRDVIHEDALRVERTIKAPDYGFRIGGARKFFVEAKRPSIDVAQDATAAFQLRRYAWTAKLPLSILTNFEKLAVYDCRVKPDKNDKASTARILQFHYREYLDRWGEIAGIFSREAILHGAFDRFAESTKKKRGTAEVDEAFLEEIESWRDALARNLSLRNERLGDRDLNFAVQRIIDRIVFLRMCEGRGIEPFGQLQALMGGTAVYRRLVEMFHRADERYNSGLFHFQEEKGREPPDELTTTLAVDDKVLKDILVRLYYPESPYEFAALPADILGQVYEQFLGKVIRLTAGHRAKVEEKPEVRKAGGVYYTPTYIVEYIVANTVGKLVEGKTPQEVGGLTAGWRPAKTRRPLSVLDPACGSGSFLIVAYQYLLDWYLKQYTEADDPQKHARGANPRVYQYSNGGWRLTTAERKRILLSHIYGVDIDYQAVEVTKLSLLLKVLEGETEETLQRQHRLFHKDRALPDLAGNIKCGNSLIGSDFYNGQQMSLLDEDERLRINVFDWDGKDGFRDIMAPGGFDAVIGNPPYLFITEVPADMRSYYGERYTTVSYRFDLYGTFIEKGIRELLGEGGVFGFITPHTLLSNDSFSKLRALLAADTSLLKIVDFGPGVFKTAKNETMILLFQKFRPTPEHAVEVIRAMPRQWPEPVGRFSTNQLSWAQPDGSPWMVHVNGEQRALLDRMDSCGTLLGDVCTANQGVRTGNNEKYLAPKPRGKRWYRAAGGRHIARYRPIPRELYVLYDPRLLDAPRKPELFLTPAKILVQEIRNIALPRRIVATLDVEQVFGLQSTNVINMKPGAPFDVRYVLGILNSIAVNLYFRFRFPGNNHIPSNQLLQIPIPAPHNEKRHDRMVALVRQMLDLNARLPHLKTAYDQAALQRQIDATDRQIDRLVYELYGLSDEEIRLVEEAETP